MVALPVWCSARPPAFRPSVASWAFAFKRPSGVGILGGAGIGLAYGVGGIVGPLLGGWMGDAQRWTWAFVPAGLACFAGAAIMMTMRAPKREVLTETARLPKAA